MTVAKLAINDKHARCASKGGHDQLGAILYTQHRCRSGAKASAPMKNVKAQQQRHAQPRVLVLFNGIHEAKRPHQKNDQPYPTTQSGGDAYARHQSTHPAR